MGKPYVTDTAGDHVPHARSMGFDCIVGDRESKAPDTRNSCSVMLL